MTSAKEWDSTLRRPFDAIRSLPSMSPSTGDAHPYIGFIGERQGTEFELALSPDDELILVLRDYRTPRAHPICHFYGFGHSRHPYQGCWSLFQDAVSPMISDWRWNRDLSINFSEPLDELERTTILVEEGFELDASSLLYDALVYVNSKTPAVSDAALLMAEAVMLETSMAELNVSGSILTSIVPDVRPTLVVGLDEHSGSLLSLSPLRIEVDVRNPGQVLRSHARIFEQLTKYQVQELDSIAYQLATRQ